MYRIEPLFRFNHTYGRVVNLYFTILNPIKKKNTRMHLMSTSGYKVYIGIEENYFTSANEFST